MHNLDSWIKIDQLDVTCFIISLFTAQHVSNVSTSIFRSLLLTVDLFQVLYFSGSMCVGVTVWFVWGGVVSLCRPLKMDLLTSETFWAVNSEIKKASDIKLVYVLTCFNQTSHVSHFIHYQILRTFTIVKILGPQHLNSNWDYSAGALMMTC